MLLNIDIIRVIKMDNIRDANFCGNCKYASKNVTYNSNAYTPGLNEMIIYCNKKCCITSTFMVCDDYERKENWMGLK